MRWVFALLMLAAQAGAATGNWLKLDTPHFEILSQTTEADLRALAGQLESAAGILRTLEPGAGRSSNSVRVFIFASRQDFERYGANKKPVETGYYHSGAGGEVIAFLHTGPSSRSVIFHEYAHLAVHRAGGRMPLWLDEGLAELYATIRIQGKQVLWGGPAAWRLPAITRGQLFNAREFFETAQSSQTDSGSARFYAQSWAFTHMLRFGREYAGGLEEFRKLLGQNMPEADAFELAFGKSRTAALGELPFYLRAGRFEEQPLPVAASPPFVAGRASRYSREEASYALADLLLRLGRTDQARRIYDELSRGHGLNAEAFKLLGGLALAQDRPEEARSHYQRALDMGSKDAGLYFEYAMLLRDGGAPPDRVQGLLELALELDPGLPGLQQFLGNRALDEGDHRLAIERFSRATLLQPEKPELWLGLAYAHRAAGNREAARAAARQSAKLAREGTQLRIAEAALEELEAQADHPPASSGPKTIVPESWKNRQGNRRLEGTLVRIDCEGVSAKLHLRSEGKIEVLSISDPRKVVLRNTPGVTREFRCGTFGEVNVAVEFIAAPEGRKDTAGEVTALDFK